MLSTPFLSAPLEVKEQSKIVVALTGTDGSGGGGGGGGVKRLEAVW